MPRRKQFKYDTYKHTKGCYYYKRYLGKGESREFVEDTNLESLPIKTEEASKKIMVELCAGYAEYATSYARANPNGKSLAIDIKEDRLLTGLLEARKEGVLNLECLACDIYNLGRIMDRYADIIYLVHPDPQANHEKKRLNQSEFQKTFYNALKPGGRFVLITDNTSFFEEYLEVFKSLDDEQKEAKEPKIREVFMTKEAENLDPEILKNLDLVIVKTRYNKVFVRNGNLTKILVVEKILSL